MIGTVMIVDDETLVRKTLRKMIESNQTGFTVIAEATNGQEAIELIHEWEPDLIISDVRMPLLDGIQLAEWVYTERPSTMVIILTGYRDFEYAQAALRYGVLDFLLKPCPEQEVCRSLKKLHGRLSHAKHTARIEEEFVEENTIRSLFYRLPCNPQAVKRLYPKLAGSTLWLVKVNHFFPATKSYTSSDLFLLQFAVSNIIQELIEPLFEHSRIVLIRYDRYAIFLGKPRSQSDKQTDALLDSISGKIQELLDIAVTLQAMGRVERLEQLPVLSESANPPSSTPDSQTTELPSSQDFTLNHSKLQSMESQFMSYIVLGQIELLQQNLTELPIKVNQLPVEEARLDALAAAITLQSIARKHFNAEKMPFDFEQEISRLHQYSKAEQIGDWLEPSIHYFDSALERWAGRKQISVRERAVAYIDRFFMDRCSLQDVASHVYLNPKYFSLLFKRETGLGFNQYVTQVRLEKAELLLSNTNDKMTEIARAVGYDDPNYFSTVFRKKHRMSPNEFRRLHRP